MSPLFCNYENLHSAVFRQYSPSGQSSEGLLVLALLVLFLSATEPRRFRPYIRNIYSSARPAPFAKGAGSRSTSLIKLDHISSSARKYRQLRCLYFSRSTSLINAKNYIGSLHTGSSTDSPQAERRPQPPSPPHQITCRSVENRTRASPTRRVYTATILHSAAFGVGAWRAYSHYTLSPYLRVPERGLEPPCLAAYAPEAYVSTNFTTPANKAIKQCGLSYCRQRDPTTQTARSGAHFTTIFKIVCNDTLRAPHAPYRPPIGAPWIRERPLRICSRSLPSRLSSPRPAMSVFFS
jgi:hypothetical protein